MLCIGDHFGVDLKRNGDHFGVDLGIISGLEIISGAVQMRVLQLHVQVRCSLTRRDCLKLSHGKITHSPLVPIARIERLI